MLGLLCFHLPLLDGDLGQVKVDLALDSFIFLFIFGILECLDLILVPHFVFQFNRFLLQQFLLHKLLLFFVLLFCCLLFLLNLLLERFEHLRWVPHLAGDRA